ncbi:cyclic lactone autoinducer peptide [Metaclostridioides mangenotii]|uniref:cyclic lactone autoinducer peptide n=1 Tax=Metaclostridioides mangenotii TaxID=1540 RepID=UPI0009DFCE3F|nr:cyclic lactone autoinducer peptide [Clostridioides mangenotii]
MKKDVMSTLLEGVGSLAMSTLKLSANSTSAVLSHQPKLPKNLNQFKKKSK